MKQREQFSLSVVTETIPNPDLSGFQLMPADFTLFRFT